ncbi:OTU domain-containing protein 4 isoform X2 [Erinaceus europaeus]|uniref:ubiquitinyl hydrolase 1 n=1 Tax=Erinaceus europaeus TaxID=9365 RepID=A0ABM3WEI1_ERIEU|nr:OTU domain-containing protein 4 isoform X2 [Erinaceus europaeus]
MEAAVGVPDGGERGPRADATPMDAYLRKLGLYRKLVAKDGSCLFRAVAEQVLHSQSRHVEVRMACIHYLRENREKFEAEWVGQVEISALSLMYRKDFIIYREPDVSPSQVTENNFPEKVLLCFSNGNHYDIVYPIKYKESSAVCQSLLYELLYEKVFKTDVSKIFMGLDSSEVAEENNSEISDSEDDSCKNKTTTANDMNGHKALSNDQHPKNNGNSPGLPLSRKVLKSLNPAVYRNVDYEVWLKSKQAQQKRDYSIAAGLQYEVGDKCQVRLDHNGKFSNADIQGAHSENGPVLVEELGKKQSLKNLKTAPSESWNTVSGKKMKKPSTSGQNFHSDVDYRGPKNSSKPVKAPSALPPRLQHPSGVRQHTFSAGPQSQKPSSEHRNLNRTPSQIIRKSDRERAEDFDHTSRESNYFGLSPEERREKQAIEESRLLYEIQNRDEQAFPALSSPSVSQSASQSSTLCVQKKSSHASDRKGSRRRADAEERKDKDTLHGHSHLDKKPEPSTVESVSEDKSARISSPSKSKKLESSSLAEQKPGEHVSLSNPAPLLVSPEVHLTPAVPSLPATVPAWPSEPTTFGPTGVPAQIPVLSVTQTLTTGPDSAVSQAHLTPSPVPVSIQAVNQPLMPLPQTLSLYQDPLYPGFPCNEKGERAIAPPYSLCHTGEDLPKDKNILRFFFNLGVKAYSCPMWAPHSYLYPLHQAYLAACRMYPKVPVYPNTWFPEAPAQNDSDCTCTDAHFPMQTEAGVNGQMPQAEMGPPAFSSPLVIPPTQVSEGHGQLTYQADLGSENSGQLLQAEYGESLGGKNMFPQPSFGPNPFMGPVPIAPPFFPPVWYGYPFQGFIENPVMRQSIVLPADEKGELDLPLENLDLSRECGSVSAASQCQDAGREGARSLPEAQAALTPQADQAPTPMSPGPEGKVQRPTQILSREREAVPAELEPKRTIPSLKEKPEKVKDPKSAADMVSGASSVEGRVQRPKEESSEDESEVSSILKSGRSKHFYNQTYGSRKHKGDWGNASRGGYQHARGEESWKGQPGRSRDEGFQHHRNARGRPFRGDRRRSGMGDGHRGQHT